MKLLSLGAGGKVAPNASESRPQRPVISGPGTLGAALEAERDGLGAIRFVDGRPIWEAGGLPRCVARGCYETSVKASGGDLRCAKHFPKVVK